MINDHYMNREGCTKHKFEFCASCGFYECELVPEYMNFKENHVAAASTESHQRIFTSVTVSTVLAENSEVKDHKGVPILMGTSTIAAEDGENDKDFAYEASIFSSGENSYEVDSPSYDREELKNGCILNFRKNVRNLVQVECGRKNVTDGIGDHYKIETGYDYRIETTTVDRWNPLQPVFISAQTGQGKNYFIEHSLIPYVKDLNYRKMTEQRILILSNRLALKQQMKNRLQGKDDPDDENGLIYSYGGFADVATYQSLLKMESRFKKRQKNARTRYIYIVCDEAHFFTSDAMFNPHTQKILSAIVQLFQDAVRVYMSATPYECLEYIIKYEERYKDLYLNWNKPQNKCKYGNMVFYHFKRDYSYLDVSYYSRIEELYEKIVASISKKREKWLIFIDDKEKCAAVKEALEQYGHIEGTDDSITDKIFAVDATSKEHESYRDMVLKETLSKDIYVLISTSVLDNGVNLRGIDNIVVSDMSKVKCLQMVGRARVRDSDDRKTLYIKRFDGDYVRKRIWDLEIQKDAYHSYEMANSGGHFEFAFREKYYGSDERDWRNAKHWFGMSREIPAELYLNEIAKSLLDKSIQQYQFISEEMAIESKQDVEIPDTGNRRTVGQKYLEYQLSWFGKRYCVDNDMTFADKKKSQKDFIAFLNSYVASEEQISQENQDAFKAEFTKMYDKAFQRADRNVTRKYNINKMNKLLRGQGICYKVDSRSSYWLVIIHKWDSENSEL